MGSDNSKPLSSSSSYQKKNTNIMTSTITNPASAFTAHVSSALNGARRLALEKRNLFAGTEHVLYQLLANPNNTSTNTKDENEKSLATFLNGKSSAPVSQLAARAMALITATKSSSSSSQQFVSASLSRALEIAHHIAKSRPTTQHSNKIDELTLFLGMLAVQKADGHVTATSKLVSEWLLAAAAPASGGNGEQDGKTTLTIDNLFAQVAEEANTSAAINVPPRKIAQFGLEWGSQPVQVKFDGGANSNKQQQGAQQSRFSEFSSPISNTHWVFPGKFLCGMSAGRHSASELRRMIEELGVNVFVCLQTSYNEYGCNDYRQTIKSFAGQGLTSPTSNQIRFLHCPIPDFGVIDDQSLVALVRELQKLLAEEHQQGGASQKTVIYCHCMGGHGRTGSAVSNLISAVEGLPLDQALRRLQQMHRARRECGGHCALGCGELEADEQVEQAARVSGAMMRQKHIN